MARFVLQPCKVREDRLVPAEGEPVELDWLALCARLAPSRARSACLNLRLLQMGAFVGLLRREEEVRNFVLLNPDRSGSIATLLKKEEGWASQLVEVYRVEQALWDSKIVEGA